MGNYNKLLEKAKGVYKTCTTDAERKVIESIFPELRESEDERIRKEILEYFRLFDNRELHGVDISDWIAWLEKQGEKKSADTVESKFRVGDWIVQNGVGTYKIVEVCESWYEVISYNNDGMEMQYSISFDKDNDCHLWTIEDAKDGDVLVDYNDESPFIFKGFLDPYHPNCPVAYCGINAMNMFHVSYRNCFWEDGNVKPASKKQRELLFSKMKEAGYEWDNGNKALIDSISDDE